jgi:hypothetical protein
MVVVGAASVFWMRPSRLPGECHAEATPAILPEGGGIIMEKQTAAGCGRSNLEALALETDDDLLDATGRIGPAMSLTGLANGNSLSDRNLIRPL